MSRPRVSRMLIALAAGTLIGAGALQAQTTWYVDDDAPPCGDGVSWATAFTYLQDALADAAGGDQIRVAQGTYTPDRDCANPTGSGDRTASFELLSGVGLYGGYRGVDPNTPGDPNDRDPNTFDSILSGDLDGDDDPNFVNYGENSYHVVTGSNTDPNTVLDGFTITAGNADEPDWPHNSGGGMFNQSATPRLANCTFSVNRAAHGGGMVNDPASPTLVNCAFIGNWAGSTGGGMLNAASAPTLTDCTFSGNWADSGGGVHNREQADPTLTNCTFTGNTAGLGGGMNADGSPILTNCTFDGNSADDSGGAMHLVQGAPVLVGCTFTQNVAGGNGGGLFSNDSSPTLTGCLFGANSAAHGGGAANENASAPTLTDCTFVDNAATNSGGGMENSDDAILTNCTFDGNTALGGAGMMNGGSPQLIGCTFNGNAADGAGGGIHNVNGNPVLTNCTFTENTAHYGAGFFGNWGNPVVTGCTFTDNSAGYSAGGLLTQNDGTLTISGCTVSSNSASLGGGVFCQWSSTALITNCLIIDNAASFDGGGVYCQSGNAEIVNCTISGNSAANRGGGIGCSSNSSAVITNCILWANGALEGPELVVEQCSDPSAVTVSYSDVGGGESAVAIDPNSVLVWGAGNIDEFPFAFGGDPSERYLASPDSPCIDAGDNTTVPPEVDTDLDGNPRFLDDPVTVDTGNPDPNDPNKPIVDMGCYEFNPDGLYLAISPTEIEFFAPEDGANPADQVLSIRNIGAVLLDWQVAEDCPWLDLDPNNGQSSGEIDAVAISVDTTDLPHGEYTCELTVSAPQAPNSPRTVQVTLFLNAMLDVPSGYGTIQAAIDASIKGDTVVIAEGTYTGPGNRDLDFGARDITVRSTDPSDPNVVAATIIDCVHDPNDPNAPVDPNDPNMLHRGFTFHSGEGPDAVVAGLTITNGNAPWEEMWGPVSVGGAIYCEASSPTISRCTITDNQAQWGGGIYSDWRSSLTVSHCTISGNRALEAPNGGQGGGLACDGGATISNCLISGNSATLGGGGAVCVRATVSDCTITANSAYYAAGGIAAILSTVVNCTITANTTFYYGGGVFCQSYPGWDETTVTNCIVNSNTAFVSGGGIYLWGGRTSVANCTLYQNAAGLLGGGVHCGSGASATLYNSVLWGDGAPAGPEIGLLGEDPVFDPYAEHANLTVAYCNVQGGQATVWVGPDDTLIWGDGNIDADPTFVAPAAGDYHLDPNSPCIDAGDNTAVPADVADLDGDGNTAEPTPLDLGGRLRFADRIATLDTGNPDANYPDLPIVDMGAYEHQCTGDLNGNGVIDLADLAELLGSYGTTSGAVYTDGDLDRDGDVDLADLAELLGAYGTTCN